MFQSLMKKAGRGLKAAWRWVMSFCRGPAAWYAGLAVLLFALGMASYGWRNRSAVRFERLAQEAVTDGPVAAMAAASPAPVNPLTALPTPKPTREPLIFQWPVNGEIIGAYAPETMVWSQTLSQWQTHPALDIAAGAGEAVCACADGTVAEVWEDALWGKSIRIEHADGYASLYANLSTLKLVSVGDAVRAGQTISAVGRSAGAESELPWHLHFALEKDGKSVDFEKIMGQTGR